MISSLDGVFSKNVKGMKKMAIGELLSTRVVATRCLEAGLLEPKVDFIVELHREKRAEKLPVYAAAHFGTMNLSYTVRSKELKVEDKERLFMALGEGFVRYR